MSTSKLVRERGPLDTAPRAVSKRTKIGGGGKLDVKNYSILSFLLIFLPFSTFVQFIQCSRRCRVAAKFPLQLQKRVKYFRFFQTWMGLKTTVVGAWPKPDDLDLPDWFSEKVLTCIYNHMYSHLIILYQNLAEANIPISVVGYGYTWNGSLSYLCTH